MIERASADPRFRDHPGLTLYGIESYIAVPLFRGPGEFFGTLCALDPLPAALPEQKLEVFHLLAQLISHQLEEERQKEERERFIGILGHDLRDPLNAISLTADLLLVRDDLPAGAGAAVERVARSAARMDLMVREILDFARGRLAGGLAVHRTEVDLAALARRVVEEVQATSPETPIRLAAADALACDGDEGRLGQLLSNLLVNAVQHAPAGSPVAVRLARDGAHAALEVRNDGPPIPSELLPHLFEPFRRGGAPGRGEVSAGLGLGLYIASEIAHAHGGRIEACSDAESGTVFTVTLPC